MLRRVAVRLPAATVRGVERRLHSNSSNANTSFITPSSTCTCTVPSGRSHIRTLTTRAAAIDSLSSSSDQGWEGRRARAALALGLSFTAAVIAGSLTSPAQAEAAVAAEKMYTKADVQAHKTKETGVWVTYQGGVYDITKFAENHPGGNKILMAAGGPVEPYWNLYAVHKDPEVQKTIQEILGELRIGTLKHSPEDEKEVDLDDPYAHEPERHPAFKINTLKPFNAEPPGSLLVDSFITPNVLFFKRNHLPVPDIKEENYLLEVSVEGGKSFKLTLEDLKRNFTHHKVTTTMQCAGNRRALIHQVKHVKGLSWTGFAISNAEWTGVRLRDVLLWAGVPEDYDEVGLAHVHFQGLDTDMSKQTYEASIPITKAVDRRGDVLLAFEMNGVPIPRDHGYPVRAVVPGTVGARNVKWVGKVIASKTESQGFWQQRDYKNFSPSTDWDNVDFDKAPAIQDMPIQSAIAAIEGGLVEGEGEGEEEEEEEEGGGPLTIKGYAYSGGGRGVARVDVSIDGGKTWEVAEIKEGGWKHGDYARTWTWALWEHHVPEAKLEGLKEADICVKATDTSYNVQPEGIEPYWNLRGVLANSWARQKVALRKEAA